MKVYRAAAFSETDAAAVERKLLGVQWVDATFFNRTGLLERRIDGSNGQTGLSDAAKAALWPLEAWAVTQ